jgi:CO/xanthine dehydrogenase Mo-binding subunit
MAAETLFGLPARDLAEMRDGVLRYQSEGRSSSVKFEEVAQKLEHRGDASLEVKEVYTSPRTYGLEARGNVDEKDYRLYPAYSYTTTVAVVEVNELLGQVEVTDLHIFQDVGKAINPLMIEGQLQGSCLQALGYALKEEYRIQGGVPQDLTFKKLGVPSILDAPRYHCVLIETTDPHGPFGAKGISEVAMIPTAPAIVNAIRDATGTRVYSLPARIEKIRAIHDHSSEGVHSS